MPSSANNCLIARQPILNRSSNIVGYELLFRPVSPVPLSTTNASTYTTANVALNTLMSFGVGHVLGEHRGFLNVEFEFLMSDALEILPRDRIVLELLESLEVTPQLVERCRELRDKGFVLALDDHEYDPVYEELYRVADIVKLDLLQTPMDRLGDMVRELRRYPVKLLAEKVETREEFEACRRMGFELFQGYYFAKPAIMEKRRIDETADTLLRLVRLLGEDAEIDAIEEVFRRSPGLAYKLLQLINSVAIPTIRSIDSIRHALLLLGRRQLQRWVQLALFASGDGLGGMSPLIEMAAVRASFMENLALQHPSLKEDGNAADQAFMTGILSVLDNIYDIDLGEIVSELSLPQAVSRALIAREGLLGCLLSMAELLDQSYGNVAPEQIEDCGLSRKDVHYAMLKAYQWIGAQR